MGAIFHQIVTGIRRMREAGWGLAKLECTSTRRTLWATCIALGKDHPLSSHTLEVRGAVDTFTAIFTIRVHLDRGIGPSLIIGEH